VFLALNLGTIQTIRYAFWYFSDPPPSCDMHVTYLIRFFLTIRLWIVSIIIKNVCFQSLVFLLNMTLYFQKLKHVLKTSRYTLLNPSHLRMSRIIWMATYVNSNCELESWSLLRFDLSNRLRCFKVHRIIISKQNSDFLKVENLAKAITPHEDLVFFCCGAIKDQIIEAICS